LQVFAETMDGLRRDEEQEKLIGDMIRDGGDDVGSFLNESGEGMEDPDRRDGSGDDETEGEADGSGAGKIICTTNSGEVY